MMSTYRLWIALLIFIVGLAPATNCFAKVSDEEAARLGKDLTPIGAEKAGNADGTIPPWEGGLTYENYPDLPKVKPGDRRPDPFPDDKPLFTINAQNVDQYKDKLSPGQVAMFGKHPDWKMNVFTTRRTSTYPKRIMGYTVKNATRAFLSEDGLTAVGAKGGYPFPIPKNGNEAILNHLYAYLYDNCKVHTEAYIVLSNGTIVDNAQGWFQSTMPYHMEGTLGSEQRFNVNMSYTSPPRRVGEIILALDKLNGDRAAWLYTPGQRRVRRAPSLSYDTPEPGTGNLGTYDDIYMYNGKIDRFDWKLIGKKEMYIMNNNYRADLVPIEELLTPKRINPDVLRNELHRVWVVEATLKEGKRHCYGRRVFYLDEDTWQVSVQDKYDNRGGLWRTQSSTHAMLYEYGMPNTRAWNFVDFTTDTYSVSSVTNAAPVQAIYNQPGLVDERVFTPEYLRRAGRR